ncbi:hypothetical protein E8P82_12720 [Arthrobacter echini]|uniref:Uncharacterized protein n=1 Tax=Arthrobacter echini TaxID=1529066 RepID=A0A4S5E1I2_9MICC|nr:hypothetical protein [Arthrobacter echini]THJ65170.1 hypothetical protein E8P82_12720 [Arthrobacter echini]
MITDVLHWAALVLCAVATLLRLPGALRGRGRTMCGVLLLLTFAVALSIEPLYDAVDGMLGGVNAANLLLRLILYAVLALLGVRVAAAFESPLVRRLIAGPFGLAVLALTIASTLYFFLASELPGSSVGLNDFLDQATVQEYAAVGRLYPGYVAACLVLPTARSVIDGRARTIHRTAGGLLAGGSLLVVVFVVLRLTGLDLMTWNVILPFSAILLMVFGLFLIWLSHARSRRRAARTTGLA